MISLSADQVSKINENSSQRENGTVLAVNLDEYRTPEREGAEIMEWLACFTSTSLLTVIVFSSPQAIVNSESPWYCQRLEIGNQWHHFHFLVAYLKNQPLLFVLLQKPCSTHFL
jgi:hypothetical protein